MIAAYFLLTWLGWIATALALAGTVYALAAIALARRFMRAPMPLATGFPPVTLLKPLFGDELGLKENLESFCVQNYPTAIQLVFGVQDASDKAIAVVKQVQAAHAALDIELVIDTRLHGPNPKISNLVNMQARARHDLLVLSDSDISVGADYLRGVVGALQPADVGAVTCLYTGTALGNGWSRLTAMGINYQFLPNVLFGNALGLAAPCFGSTIALKRPVLERIGGFAAFSGSLADDYEIGRAVRGAGYSVALPPFAVAHGCAEQSALDLWSHELRWARTIRILQAPGHWGSLITHPLPLALLGSILTGFTPASSVAVAAALGARLVLKLGIDRVFGKSAGPIWLLPLRDVLSFGVFFASLFGGKVSWRGSRFRVSAGGALTRS